MSNVYVVNDTGQNYAKASTFGKVKTLIKGKVDPFRPHLAQQAISEGLKDFNPVTDFLIPSGAALANGFAFAWLTMHALSESESEVKIKLLLFDAKKLEYIERCVSL